MIDGLRTGDADEIRLLLFVAPNAHSSALALKHLQQALKRYEPHVFDLEIVDVVAEPHRLMREGVLITPTLLAQESRQRVIGDLSNASLLDYFLQSLFALRSGRRSQHGDGSHGDRSAM